MVKIDIDREKKFTMETTKKMEKIQIYPSKQQHNSFNNKIKPKLIMSPLTTMPTNAKKLMIAANGIQMKQQNIMHQQQQQQQQQQSTANENNVNSKKKEDNNDVKLPTDTIMKENSTTSVNLIPLPMNDKLPESTAQENSNATTTTTVDIEKRSEETAGYRSEKEKITLGDVHPYITCYLCKGYLIEATTIVECLHTYCHSCLMKHLSREKCCPQCEMSINKSKTNIKYDATIQSIVYKLVPGLYEKELLRRRAFYKQRPDEAKLATPEERGDDTEHLIFSPSDLISLSIDYAEKETLKGMESDPHVQNLLKPRFLNCPAIFKVEYLKKFILNKFHININKFNVEISYKVKTIVLPEHYTLMDVAYIYTWKKEAPMPFFFRIIAKNSRSNELPEVSLRRSPTNMTNLNDDLNDTSTNTLSKKKSVSFKEDVESSDIKAGKDVQKASNVSSSKGGNGMSYVGGKNENAEVKKSSPPTPQQPPRVESIKLKFDVSNNNVSIIKPDGTTVKTDTKSKKKDKESKKASKFDNNNFIIENKSPLLNNEKRDEYEFDDEIEKQKLGFLNTFQLTAKKMLMQKNTNLSQNNNNNSTNKNNNKNSSDSKITSVTKKDENTNSKNIEEGKNLTQKSTAENNNSNVNKRKSKEPVKAEKAKKYKFHEMKSVSEGSKFLFTKTGDGHEITFDMSLKPLGSKPPLSKVKSDILMAQQRADAKAIQSKNEANNASEKNQANKTPQIKPKKLPMLLPKQTPQTNTNITSTFIAPTSMSPTAFVIKKPDAIQKEPEIATTSEISVRKLSDVNHQYRVFGPSSPETNNKEKEPEAQFKSPKDVFVQPLPPKPKANPLTAPPTTIPVSSASKPFGFGPKQPKVIPENMQTPYGSRTPFYVPSSPSYTPNFDPKPQFKYANPNAYASFMQSMFSPVNDKIPAPINTSQSSKIPSVSSPTDSKNPRKRLSTDSMPNLSKRKSPSPTKSTNTTVPTQPTTTTTQVSTSSTATSTTNTSGDTETKAISILNKISFPSSLSVTLTNEQEENKKEQLRSQKQNVNNNIEIIKISDEKEAAKNSKSPSPPKNSNNEKPENANEKQQIQKKLPELKKLSPILPAPPNVSSMQPPILPPPAVAKALSDSKESFQRAFLESLMSVTNRDKNMDNKNTHRKKEGKSQSASASPDAYKNKNHSDLESKSDLKKNSNNQDNGMMGTTTSTSAAQPKKNLSLTPPLSKNNNDKLNSSTNSVMKSLTPPPPMMMQDHSMFSPQAVAASSAVQFNLMLNALNAAAATGGAPFAFPDYANIQRTMLLETLRKNVEKSNALLAMHHQLQQQQQNQKTSPNSSSSSSKH
ncbi:hypothetical protein ACKWTF_002914 [Chironomus riparius]